MDTNHRIWAGESRPFPNLRHLMLAALAIATMGGFEQPKAKEPSALVLFDGESLDGWKPTDFFRRGEVKVEDGVIILATSTASAGMTGITSTRTDLPRTNYELRYEAKRLNGRDFFAAATFPVGEDCLTLVNGGWSGHVTGLSSINGADASENETSTFFKFEDQTWYRFRIWVTDKAIRCWIDDKEVVTLDYRDRHLGTRIETRASEPLGFASWETSGALRGIEIRALTPDEIQASEPSDQ